LADPLWWWKCHDQCEWIPGTLIVWAVWWCTSGYVGYDEGGQLTGGA
jgi:hypothetical protein